MRVIIKFKELRITEAKSVDEVCKRIERRNPDAIIDEAYQDEM